MFFPRRRPLNVVLFTSTFSTEKTLLEITLKLGLILRVLLVFRVTSVYWVLDEKRYKKIIEDVTEYALKPPYLKKGIPKKRTLRFVGLLPPFLPATYDLVKGGAEGELRVLERGNAGLDRKLKKPDGVYILTDNLRARLRKYGDVYYRGFRTYFVDEVELEKLNNVVIGDRFGSSINDVKDELIKKFEEGGLTLVIGPPSGLKPGLRGVRVNFVPNQGVKDVRTEEALISALAILNSILG
mgnify:CR=1 FL=1